MTISVETLQWIRIGAGAIWLTLMTFCIFIGRGLMWHPRWGAFLMGVAVGGIGSALLLGIIVTTNGMP